MFVPFNYLVSAAIHYGVSTTMAFNLIPILNGARYEISSPLYIEYHFVEHN
jgi:hypothetical protein